MPVSCLAHTWLCPESWQRKAEVAPTCKELEPHKALYQFTIRPAVMLAWSADHASASYLKAQAQQLAIVAERGRRVQ